MWLFVLLSLHTPKKDTQLKTTAKDEEKGNNSIQFKILLLLAKEIISLDNLFPTSNQSAYIIWPIF